jgi:hypothetical protein
MKVLPLLAVCALSVLLQGCAGISTRPLVSPSAESIFPYKPTKVGRETQTALSTVHLGALISDTTCEDESKPALCIANALREANKAPSPLLRNRIQDYLIASSNEQCRIYQGKLRTAAAEPNFWLGVGTTAFGGAGAITRSIEGAKILSGMAAILSGTRAEFNQEFFANQTADVLIGSINSARKEVLTAIAASRGSAGTEPVEKYTIERSLADAIDYHSKCSIASALQHAGKALAEYDDIGYRRFNEFVARAELSRASISANALVSTADWAALLGSRIDARDQGLDASLNAAKQRYRARHGNELDCMAVLATNAACKAASDGKVLTKDAMAFVFKLENMTLDRTKFAAAIDTLVTAVQSAEGKLAKAIADGAKATAKAELDNARTALELKKREAEAGVNGKLAELGGKVTTIDAYMSSP